MAIFKCKMCGGTIEFELGATVGTCDSCGTKQTLPSANDEVLANLHNRANTLRLKCEFDKAEEIYGKILENDPNDAEAHWGIILCKYGIEYVEEPKTYQRVPTCHRTSFDAILADSDYKAAIANGDGAQLELYKAEAKEIDRIQKDILVIVQNEKPFDVFICYKETDESGKRTIDSTIANDIYYQLTQEGFKVFYAAITLEDKIGHEYEPYIFAALNSAKVMLVIGSKSEYFTAVWVKNEWSRFLTLMKTHKDKLLIPCYKDMDAYELPEEFAHLQAQDMGKIGFINDVVRGIKKVIEPDARTAQKAEKAAPAAQPAGAGVASLLERAFLFLEDGDWSSANDYCEKVLDIEPKNAEAYLGKLMAELQVQKWEDLKECAKPFDGSSSYQKAVKFGNKELPQIITAINDRNEAARLAALYDSAVAAMYSANSESAYRAAANSFLAVSGYKDAAQLSEECLAKAEQAKAAAEISRKKLKKTISIVAPIAAACIIFVVLLITVIIPTSKYNSAKELMDAGQYHDAIAAFEAMDGYKDSDAQIENCNIALKDIDYNAAAALMNAGKYEEAIAAFKAMAGYRDSNEQIENCNIALKDIDYNAAAALLADGKYGEAIKAFVDLNGYKDSTEKAEEIYKQHKNEKLDLKDIGDVVNVGDSIFFGTYEQDNDKTNGKEDIEWVVLEKDDMSLLVISKYVLDLVQYYSGYTDSISLYAWDDSTLRIWLNGTFLNNAFSSDEQAVIDTTIVTPHSNPKYQIAHPGSSTCDKVFLLSSTEVKKYITYYSVRACKGTDYYYAQVAQNNSNGYCKWWLRTRGEDGDYASYVDTNGSVDYAGAFVRGALGVRPAMWLNLDG